MKILTRTLLCLICCFYGFSSIAQDNVDKQLQEYNSATLDQKIKLFHFFNLRIDKDSLLYYIKDLQNEGIINHRDDVLAMANYGMGTYLQTNSLYRESESKLKKALKYYRNVGNDTMSADIYNSLGNTAFLEGNTSKAEVLYYKSSESAKQSGDKKYEMLSVFNRGKIYLQQGKNDQAEKYIRDYIDFQKKTQGNLRSLASAYGSMGQLHLNQEDYEKAINDFNNSMEYGLMVGNMKTVANGYTNLGIVEYISNDFERSEQYFRLALAYRMKDDDKHFIAEGYYNLGDFYSGMEKNDSAIANYMKSAEVAGSINNLKTQIDALSQLSTVYSALDEDNKEIEVLKNIINLQDEINRQQNEDVLNALGLSFNQSMEETKSVGEIREEKLQDQLGKYRSIFNNWILIATLGIVALFGLIYFISKRTRRKLDN